MFECRKKGLAVAALAAGLLCTSVWAQTPDRDAPRGPGGEGIGPMRGFERLHRQLNLNPQQEELWNQARAAQRQAFRGLRAKGEEVRAELRVEIDKPGVDLKNFAALSDRLREQIRAQAEATRKQVREAWFAVYDSLDPAQKEQVRVAIRDGMDRARRVGHWHRGGSEG